jgi:2-succinyl-6-hydroxy-2,4-cyclohexadiene-1-carboxylate synthase
MTRMAVNGVAYEVRAAGDGPAVLLLHGFTGRGTDWSPFLRAIHAAGHRTIVVDLLGHGRSDAPSDPAAHAIERQAMDLATILRRIDAAPATVVGYSMGARIALRLAVTEPGMVRGLILESPSAGIPEPAERAARAAEDARLADRLERDGLEAFLAMWEALPLFASERRLPAEVQARIHGVRRRNRPAGLAASLRGAGQGSMEPLVDRLRSVACPSLVIAGALDPVGLERSLVFARLIPSVRLLILPDHGHAPHRESPVRFRRLLIDQLTAWRAA